MADSATKGAFGVAEPSVSRLQGRPWQSPVFIAALAIACLAGLAAAGLADWRAALFCALLVALCCLAIGLGRDPPQGVAKVGALGEQTPPFALMIENLVDPILLVSGADPADFGDRRFIFANAAARDLLRLQRDQGPLTTAMRAPEVLAAVEEALFANVAVEAAWHSRGAQERFWQTRIVPLPPGPAPGSRGSDVRLALLTFHDETEMRRSESTRADFLANASHELRTPLASLAGFIETLRGHAREDPAARDKFLGIMQAQAERMRHLIDDLMSLSRIELTEHIRPAGRSDFAAGITDVLDALAPQAAHRGVTFRSILPGTGSAIAVGDRDQLMQVAQNLIENAIKYTGPNGEVSIAVEVGVEAREASSPQCSTHAHLSLLTPDRAAGQRYVSLRVADAGAGIARNHLPRLTERFYRVEGQKTREHPGTGLGLAIVKHIVNRHRGGMVVESALGEGSIFTVYVPMAEDVEIPLEPVAASLFASVADVSPKQPLEAKTSG